MNSAFKGYRTVQILNYLFLFEFWLCLSRTRSITFRLSTLWALGLIIILFLTLFNIHESVFMTTHLFSDIMRVVSFVCLSFPLAWVIILRFFKF